MEFKKNTRAKPIDYEKQLVKYWQDNKIFEKSIEQRDPKNPYVFYDGPPFITGVPHYGNLLSSIIKDAVPRYWTMKGKRVERRWGWDCHGLPAEVYTEKKFGIVDRRDIGTKISLEEYIRTCRDNMIQTGDEWEQTIYRIGRWVDFKGAYRTMDNDYMESVWWAFKELYEKKKIYEGEKVLLYCTHDATPISKAEVAMDNSYQDVTDPSVFVKFKLSKTDKYLLAWTTTPWTLLANSAVALNQAEDYSEIEIEGQHLIIAKKRLDSVLRDEKHKPLKYKLVSTFKGKKLVGQNYEPLFENQGDNAHKIYHADYVTLEDGTGIVHLAPAYGEEDYDLAKKEGIPVTINIDENGFYTKGEWQGQQVWSVNKIIAKELFTRGIVWKIEYIRHSYPHCHRCGTRLMYRAHPSWFMDINSQRSEMLAKNKSINWFPEHFKAGRFVNIVETAPDWNLSRDRFWATPIPVWKGKDKDGKEYIRVVGSYKELKELSGIELEDYHRPWIDEVSFEIDGVEYRRIDKVMDCWFESGSMPFAQFHYPFENKQKFEDNFPGDFVAEYVGQVRGWFYYLHAISIGLFGKESFKNVIVTGTLLGQDGRKLSKSLNNFTDPNLIIDKYSADALRFLLLSSPALSGEDYSVLDKDIADISRKLSMIWNMFDFFTLYASVDKWKWSGSYEDPLDDLVNPLDRWIISRIHQLTENMGKCMDEYDLPKTLKPVIEFIDDASNWYVRRSRRRFWKSDSDIDKANAYKTLHYILVRLAIVLAPFTPFLSEELYQKLTGGESVHLLDWPEEGKVDNDVIENMAIVRDLIAQGLAQRALEGVKVRQPLSSVDLTTVRNIDEQLQEIVKEELNVKRINIAVIPGKKNNAKIDTLITPELREEGMSRELVRCIQSARKQADFNVEDRISLFVESESPEILQVIQKYKDTIMSETLAEEFGEVPADAFETTVKIDGLEIRIVISKYLV
ncbi:MAG TPA: isoleucine--tRNA ligase [Candidatus Saccharimonadales bacterium]|jgi:isoleucyl-tRNA synthetase|nr:isoleucine--tRNA ligase [Candidatus Saccharimonadales bacterium]